MISRARPVTGGGWQLNLTLPQSTASHARLDFAVPVDLQRLPADAVSETQRDEQGVRAVELWGLSGPIFLTWSEITPQIAVPPVVQSQSRIKLDLTTIPVSLNGTQSLQITGGSLSEVSVVYPPGFELQEVSARNSANASVLKNFESLPNENPQRTLIRLTSAVEGQLTLGFELEMKEQAFPLAVAVSLPVVREANVQTGDLDILIPSGLVVEQSKVEGGSATPRGLRRGRRGRSDRISASISGIQDSASGEGDGGTVHLHTGTGIEAGRQLRQSADALERECSPRFTPGIAAAVAAGNA